MDAYTREIVMSSPALVKKSDSYPDYFNGKVPLKIKMNCTVKSDIPFFMQSKPDVVAHKDMEYYVWCNSHGAISAILPNGERLGIKPGERQVIEWHENLSHA